MLIPEQQVKLYQDWLEVQPLKDYPHAMAVFRKSDHECLGWMLKEDAKEPPIPFDPNARGRLTDVPGQIDETTKRWKDEQQAKIKEALKGRLR